MIHYEYITSRDLTWSILMHEQVVQLPIPIMDICKHIGVVVEWSEEVSGLCQKQQDQPIIVLNRQQPLQCQRCLCAHLLGHILLGHTSKFNLTCSSSFQEGDALEQAADLFASRLLAPSIVLKDLGVTTAKQIQTYCGITSVAAEFTLKLLQQRYLSEQHALQEQGYSCFGLSELEKTVQTQFRKYVLLHKLYIDEAPTN